MRQNMWFVATISDLMPNHHLIGKFICAKVLKPSPLQLEKSNLFLDPLKKPHLFLQLFGRPSKFMVSIRSTLDRTISLHGFEQLRVGIRVPFGYFLAWYDLKPYLYVIFVELWSSPIKGEFRLETPDLLKTIPLFFP